MLADDGIIYLIAVELAARGARTVALTRAERQLAAARIVARGGTAYLISKRLHVSGTTAVLLAARCKGGVMTRVLVLADDGNRVIATGPVPKDQTVEAIRKKAGEHGWALPGHAREMPDREFRGARPADVPARHALTGKANGGPP
jgi:hypothetical protein